MGEIPEVRDLLSAVQNLEWATGDNGEACDGAVTLPNPSETIAGAQKIHVWSLNGSILLDVFYGNGKKAATINLGKSIVTE